MNTEELLKLIQMFSDEETKEIIEKLILKDKGKVRLEIEFINRSSSGK